MHHILLAVILVYSNIYIAGGSIEMRIVNGQEADMRQIPYQVQLLYFNKLFCGGSIVTKRHVISAGHCFPRNGDKYVMSPQHTTILAGSEKNSEGGMEYLISKIFVHPKYNPERTDYDLSIVAVERDIVFSQTVQPVGLPLDSWEDHIGEEGIVSGFGRTTFTSEQSEKLMKIRAPILAPEVCRKSFGPAYTQQMFCGGFVDGSKDACLGDSGGPFVLDGRLYGVVSWGHECAAAGFPGVYTDVHDFLGWIVQILESFEY